MISSLRNPHVQRARKLKKRGVRARVREFLAEGPTAVREAFARGAAVELLLVEGEGDHGAPDLLEAAASARTRVVRVAPAVMKAVSDATTPPGLVAVVPFVDADPAALVERPLSLALFVAEVRDPGNLGTMLRTAWAVGADAVFLGRGTVDLYNPKVVRSSAGAIFHVPVARDVDAAAVLTALAERGLRRIAADPRGRTLYDELDMTGPCALVFGNEAWGIPEGVSEMVDERVRIPMQGDAESVNVGVAAAVFLFEALRQRRAAG